MSVWVQYHERNSDGSFREACGDRSVVRLDGRRSLSGMHEDAQEENGHRRPVYAGYSLLRGHNLLHAKPFTKAIPLDGKKT